MTIMATIENITRKQVTDLIAKFIKESYKNMGTATNKNLDIEFGNWSSGFGRDSKWAYTRIEFGGNAYKFTDKEINDAEFVRILIDAVAIAGVRAKVLSQTYGDGYWTPKEIRFERVEMYAAPCKEFVKLTKMLEKYANFTLHETDIFEVSVCGKRSSWSDSGRFYYLCYYPNKCNAIIDYIRKNRGSKDTVVAKVEEYFSHGDEGDYKCAMYHESEWYGCRGNKLSIAISTPSGRAKALNKWSMRFADCV